VYFDDKPANVDAGKSLGMDARLVNPREGLTRTLVADLLG
jgi:hypothetical protein